MHKYRKLYLIKSDTVVKENNTSTSIHDQTYIMVVKLDVSSTGLFILSYINYEYLNMKNLC